MGLIVPGFVPDSLGEIYEAPDSRLHPVGYECTARVQGVSRSIARWYYNESKNFP